jgi:hypothetical protein
VLAQRTSSAEALRQWVDALEKEWDRLREKAQRSRNALTHGGPANTDESAAAAGFAHQFAAFALSEEPTAVADGVESSIAHADLAGNANQWREHLATPIDAASALASDLEPTTAARIMPASR